MSSSTDSEAQPDEEVEAISFAEFLESKPPNKQFAISTIAEGFHYAKAKHYRLKTPEIRLHCSHELCNGTRFFRFTDNEAPPLSREVTFSLLTYQCCNCRQRHRVFAIAAARDTTKASGTARKLGEFPSFGPPTPARLISLIGPDKDLFLKGRRCETQGLGVGAFVYYRRVVEDQKNRILSEIVKVLKTIRGSEKAIATLEAATKETRFSEALSLAEDAIPESLLISGHNPLKLLHSALSEGVHDRSDGECLETAQSVRVILVELSERIAQAIKDDAELRNALSNLMKRKP